MSRSRSRVPMDWRPASRSRSRPPPSGILSEQSSFRFLTSAPTPVSKVLSTSPSIPIPGASSGRRSPPMSLNAHFNIPLDHFPELSHANYHSLDALGVDNPAHPSSMPSHGLHGLHKLTTTAVPSPEQRTFPKHVRKTSFDHTVAKEGIFTGVSGRHQVNGKPLSPESLIGTKRRADAPHAEGMLRGDPPTGQSPVPLEQQDVEDFKHSGSPFPSSSFSFTYPSSYEAYFDLSGAANNAHIPSHLSSPKDGRLSDVQFQHSIRPSLDGTYSPIIGNGNDALSPAAVAASTAMAEGYAQLNVATNFGMEEALEYQQLVSMMYPGGMEGGHGMGQHPFTHVDPTQILPLEQQDGSFQSFHPSPSSDGWGNGVGSSSNASPEPYNTSNASSPPSVETNGNARNQVPRKLASTKRSSGDANTRPGGISTDRKG